MGRLNIILAALCVVIFVVVMQGTLLSATAPDRRKAHAVCTNCHESDLPSPGNPALIHGADRSALCLKCHKNYRRNHHPLDFEPENPSTFRFPLFDGKVTCLTCHQMHDGPRIEGTNKLLRGGPYADRRTICFQCHPPDLYSKVNPHKMLDDAGKVLTVSGRPACLWCHKTQPDPAKARTLNVQFTADIGFLCWLCHPPMPGQFFNQHFLLRPSAETRRNMRETEERLLVILPLVPHNRITCSTCHNPHEKGVILRKEAAKGADTKSGLRMTSICFGCHRK